MKRTSIATSIHPPTAPPTLAPRTLAPIVVALLLDRLSVRPLTGGMAVGVYGARVSDWVGDAVGVSLVDAALEVKDNIGVVLAAAVEGPRVALSRENTAVSVLRHCCFSASDSSRTVLLAHSLPLHIARPVRHPL
jgi:hypothetical protein